MEAPLSSIHSQESLAIRTILGGKEIGSTNCKRTKASVFAQLVEESDPEVIFHFEHWYHNNDPSSHTNDRFYLSSQYPNRPSC